MQQLLSAIAVSYACKMCATQGVQVQGGEEHPSCGCHTAVTQGLTDLSDFLLVPVCLIYDNKHFFQSQFQAEQAHFAASVDEKIMR